MARPLVLQDQALMGGLQRDAVGPAKFQSLRQMQNLDLVQDPPALRVRNGYSQIDTNISWADSNCPELQQVYPTTLRDINGNLIDFIFYVVAESDGTGYQLRRFKVGGGSSDDVEIWSPVEGGLTESPLHVNFETVENRVFFSVVGGLRWTDYSASESYPAGVIAPDVPTIANEPRVDDWASDHTMFSMALEATLAQEFTVGSVPMLVNLITVWASVTTTSGNNFLPPGGRFKISLETADGSDNPTGTLAFTGSETEWQSPGLLQSQAITASNPNGIGEEGFLPIVMRLDPILLAASTKYMVVVRTDADYRSTRTSTKYITIMGFLGVSGRPDSKNQTVAQYDADSTVWTSQSNETINFAHSVPRTRLNYLTSLPSDTPNTYVPKENFGGYVNGQSGASIDNDYAFSAIDPAGVESPLAELESVSAGGADYGVELNGLSYVDGTTILGLYRRVVTNITGTTSPTYSSGYHLIYKLTGGITTVADFTDDFQLAGQPVTPAIPLTILTDEDGSSIGLTDLVFWNERLWGFHNDTLYYSMRLEEESVYGQVGDSLPDYFPTDNTFKMNRPITALYPLREGLMVFHSNRMVMLTGAYSPLNPPPDLQSRNISSHEGVVSSKMVTEIDGNLFYYNNHNELKVFSPQGMTQELSDINQSVFDGVTQVVQLVGHKRQVVVGVEIEDDVSDGRITDLLILDLGQQRPYWKNYKYMLDADTPQYLRHLTVTDGHLLYAAGKIGSLESGLLLDSGTNDNGIIIPALAETHEVQHSRRERWSKYYLEFNYNGSPPAVTATATAKDGLTSGKSFTASGSDDVRNHNGNLRVMSESCRFQVSWNANGPDELRLIGFE